MKTFICLSYILLMSISTVIYAENKIPYPGDYRDWTHIKTLTLHSGHPLENPFKGIHHIYANTKGVKGIKSGQYENGAIIVFDLLKNKTANKASSEGERILLGTMVRDDNKYAKTGGWGFEAWAGNSKVKRLTQNKGASCFACHTSQKKTSYVFSQWRN